MRRAPSALLWKADVLEVDALLHMGVACLDVPPALVQLVLA